VSNRLGMDTCLDRTIITESLRLGCGLLTCTHLVERCAQGPWPGISKRHCRVSISWLNSRGGAPNGLPMGELSRRRLVTGRQRHGNSPNQLDAQRPDCQEGRSADRALPGQTGRRKAGVFLRRCPAQHENWIVKGLLPEFLSGEQRALHETLSRLRGQLTREEHMKDSWRLRSPAFLWSVRENRVGWITLIGRRTKIR